MRLLRAVSLLVLLLVLAPPALAAETYQVDPGHSSVEFRIRHLVSTVTGRFTSFSGTIHLEPADLAKSSVTFAIEAKSIDTNNGHRDDDLRSDHFFDVAKFPQLTFQSTSITRKGENKYEVTGKFTMHGVTKEITVPVSSLGTGKDPWGNTKAGFEAEFVLNRKDYGIVWNQALDSGGMLLGDEVTCRVALEAALKK